MIGASVMEGFYVLGINSDHRDMIEKKMPKLTFTCSQSAIETTVKGMKYVQG